MQSKEREENDEGLGNDDNNVLKLFSHLVNALKGTTKSDVNLPPKFYGDDDKWDGWYKQPMANLPTYRRRSGSPPQKILT